MPSPKVMSAAAIKILKAIENQLGTPVKTVDDLPAGKVAQITSPTGAKIQPDDVIKRTGREVQISPEFGREAEDIQDIIAARAMGDIQEQSFVHPQAASRTGKQYAINLDTENPKVIEELAAEFADPKNVRIARDPKIAELEATQSMFGRSGTGDELVDILAAGGSGPEKIRVLKTLLRNAELERKGKGLQLGATNLYQNIDQLARAATVGDLTRNVDLSKEFIDARDVARIRDPAIAEIDQLVESFKNSPRLMEAIRKGPGLKNFIAQQGVNIRARDILAPGYTPEGTRHLLDLADEAKRIGPESNILTSVPDELSVFTRRAEDAPTFDAPTRTDDFGNPISAYDQQPIIPERDPGTRFRSEHQDVGASRIEAKPAVDAEGNIVDPTEMATFLRSRKALLNPEARMIQNEQIADMIRTINNLPLKDNSKERLIEELMRMLKESKM